MMLTLETNKLEKAFIKKFENGIGIKSLNQLTGRENTVIIRAENSLLRHKSNDSSMKTEPNMIPILTDKYKGTLSKMSENKFIKSKEILAKLDQYLNSNQACGISGFHVFFEDESSASDNIQERSVILVANKNAAREGGARFEIPGKLVNLTQTNSQDDKCKFQFTADTIVKPMSLIVGEYTLHIDICCKIPPDNTTHKTVGTQTTNDYPQSTHSKSGINCDISKCNIPQPTTTNINTQSEVDRYDDTPQLHSNEVSNERLSEGEFAKMFNPKASIQKFHSKTSREDFFEVLCNYDEHSADTRSQENHSIGNVTEIKSDNPINVTEIKSENSIKTYDSQAGLSSCNFTEHLISQTFSSFENFPNIVNPNMVQADQLFQNYSNQQLSKKSKSKNSELSRNSGRYTTGSESKPFCEKIHEEMAAQNAITLNGCDKTTHTSSSDISLNEIKQKLDNVVTSLNHLNSFVQMIDDFSKKSSRDKSKYCGSNKDNSTIEIKKQCRNVSSNQNSKKEPSQTQSSGSLCDRCGSFYPLEKPMNHQCDQWNLEKHNNYYFESTKFHNNKPNSHTYCIAEKQDFILTNTAQNVQKSKSLERFINPSCLDTNNLNKTPTTTYLKKVKPENLSISKSMVIIHYNDKYQNCESSNRLFPLALKNEKENTIHTAKIGCCKKAIHGKSDEINNKLNNVKTLDGNTRTSEELVNVMFDTKASYKPNNLENFLNKNKTKDKTTLWSNTFRYSTLKLLRKREPIQPSQLSKSLPEHFKKPTQSENAEKLSFQHISNLVKFHFHKMNGTTPSSKTLHIFPSQSTSKSAQSINPPLKLIEKAKNVEHIQRKTEHSDINNTKQKSESKQSSLKNKEHINGKKSNKQTESNRYERKTKNKKWKFF